MGYTARRNATRTSDRPLVRVIATLLVLCLPAQAFAQSKQADQELEALIPDSAMENPDAWAVDTEAARTVVPPAEADDGIAPDAPLPDLPGITIAWPDGSELPKIESLTPDPDIDVAEQTTDAAVNALPGQEEADSGRSSRRADADIAKVGKQVEVAFPPGAEGIAEKDAIVARFAGLSALKSFDDDEDNLAQIVRRARTDRELLINILRIHGYYDAQVYQSLGGLSAPAAAATDTPAPIDVEKVVVRFDLQPGPQYHFGQIAFGDLASTGPDFQTLRGAFKLNPGDAINSDRIVTERVNLQNALGETGYAFAKVDEPDLLIDHERREGDLTVPVMPGGTYQIGKVNSSLEKFLSSKHLDLIARFDSGDLYKRSEIDDLRQAILATGLVSSVTVETREAKKPLGRDPGTVDVDVGLTPAPLRTIAGLVGYSSGEGFRVEASWEHRNFFPPEGLLRVRGVAGTQEQLAGVTFRRNNFMKRDLLLNADLYARNQQSPAFEALTISALVGLERQTTLLFQKPWIFAGGLEILATRERDAAAIRANEPRTTYFIGAIPLRAAYDGSDSLLDPQRGFRVGLRVSPEISVQNGVKSSYGKAQLDASYYQPTGDNLVIAGRVRLGTIVGTAIENIAPSRRFYAGGGGSVRGYGFQQIGPRDTLNEPSGGRALTEFSLEARVKTGLLGGAVSVVPFVDAGAVDTTTTPKFNDLKIGVGVGIRYQTNFGPIRIDVGTPLNPSKGDSRIGVYVALGQAF
ncbi:translocation and assembly module TamA [Novosphingobium hassiacum]|uniref:Translocation and assembly module TamA n=1 Tax=Novosphingobium hassiacum TaxID=173676 RepID=A0A7W5ZWR9_9SPHN|nr:BamA/TamA family outer membrane protein [Novosphingobium hassiacum]MBB3861385.1 translocation and assembly module TamA [Novosphingobium hassiacum]